VLAAIVRVASKLQINAKVVALAATASTIQANVDRGDISLVCVRMFASKRQKRAAMDSPPVETRITD